MKDSEFDLLDELYFMISYPELIENVELTENEIRNTLISMATKGWIRIYNNSDEELDEFDLIANFRSYFYLASKKGLLEHNRQ